MDLQPLFIVGTGRCGSTVLHDIVSTHPGLSYLSPLCDRNPSDPSANARLMRLLSLRPIEGLLRRRFYPEEVYRFWDHYAPGFSEPCRDLGRDDVLERTKRRLPAALEAAVHPSRPRLLVKITGWPRIGFLHEIFPDARFIHVYRDGRAVANSTLNVWFWRGWHGERKWRWGDLTESERETWERHGRSFVALAGLQWCKLMRSFREARDAVPSDRLMEISYETLCDQPERTLQWAADFAGIPASPRFMRSLASFDLENQNDKWRRDLSTAQQHILEDTVQEELAMWGYGGSPSPSVHASERPREKAGMARVGS